ncbi:MAG: D-alanine--D-alanine ligase, partial [Bacteroidota bacterium]|nr:D-alanine--D-alanine ligase [Bacteroidota bacterium]
GIGLLKDWDLKSFTAAVDRSFFCGYIHAHQWSHLNEEEKILFIRKYTDIYEGLGLPMETSAGIIYRPDEMHDLLELHFSNSEEPVWVEGLYTEQGVLIEEFIIGREFSCIVVEGENGQPIALPPTEIIKRTSIFDYRAKYLPGISRKVTPINLSDEGVKAIANACTELYDDLLFDVYARIDGILSEKGEIYLNDPNTTSGMLPSSFFFHQAAEIGLSPSQFLTYIIHKSLENRRDGSPQSHKLKKLLHKLDEAIAEKRRSGNKRMRVAVILGGVSTERHISVESGRNVFEKLSSSGHYDVLPLFLTQSGDQLEFYLLPYNLLLKDNADDIADKVNSYKIPSVIAEIINEAKQITGAFGSADYNFHPKKYALAELKNEVDFAFIALHGRPGEDGTLQQNLEEYGIPYNGSGPDSSSITINKFITNELLADSGLLIPAHILIERHTWLDNSETLLETIENTIGYPCIAKPADDGCSSAVKKILNKEEMKLFAKALLRDDGEVDAGFRDHFKLQSNEEIPCKTFFVVEELVKASGAARFLEITGGLLTHRNDSGELEYEIFEPSEALAEGGILSLEEKFLAGEGQNITPARFDRNPSQNKIISGKVRSELMRAAKALNIEGYCRIDAFVRIFSPENVEVIFIEVNSLPGLTPATCIFHQAALQGYKPAEFLEKIIDYGISRNERTIQA